VAKNVCEWVLRGAFEGQEDETTGVVALYLGEAERRRSELEFGGDEVGEVVV
jgi:hypothetical protein